MRSALVPVASRLVFVSVAAFALAPMAVWAKGGNGGTPAVAPHDQQRRRQAAAELQQQGFQVDWRLASWTELHDWTMRAAEARVLRERFGLAVDWRACSLAEMRDWEGRMGLAVDLRRLGADVEWRVFTARQLDDLRTFLEHTRLEHTRGGTPHNPPPAFDRGLSRDSFRLDPDAVLVPTYVTEGLARDDGDDGILEASFSLPRSKLRREGAPAARRRHASTTPLAPMTKAEAPGTVKKRKPGRPHRALRIHVDI